MKKELAQMLLRLFQDAFFCVIVEGGFLVLRGWQAGREVRVQSAAKVSLFVGSASHTLNLPSKLPLNLPFLPQDQQFAVVIDDAFTVHYGPDRISAPHELTSYASYYIGGLPASLRSR